MTERIGIVGGGILGVAIARALMQRGDVEVTVLEKESRLATHQTGRNSGVVHAGLYYQPGSLKARLCAIGRERTRDYCQEKSLPYREVGKLVVAVTQDELGRLDDIERRARENRVPDMRRVGVQEMREIEPHVDGFAAVHSPHTAVVDYAAITETMAQDVRAAGGQILLGQEVTGLRDSGDQVVVTTSAEDHVFDRLIVCAGLHSDVVATMAGADPSPKILPFRGEYWALDSKRSDLVNGMIYPVPDPAFPFLGVHFTRGVYDEITVGPNAVPALAREGYDWLTFSARDTWESLRWSGAVPMARQYWKMGIDVIGESLIKPVYFKRAQRFIPELRMKDLTTKIAAGVRAQAWGRDGELLDDFAVDQVGNVTLLRNAPSPAATSAMAIADYVLEHHLGVPPVAV